MKDFKIPELSDKERNDIFKSLKAGDELISISYSTWNCVYSIRTVKVKNVTTKGNVRLENNDLLKYLPNGCYPKDNTDVQECIKKISMENKVLNNMNHILRETKAFTNNLEYEDAVILNNILSKIFKDVK